MRTVSGWAGTMVSPARRETCCREKIQCTYLLVRGKGAHGPLLPMRLTGIHQTCLLAQLDDIHCVLVLQLLCLM